MKFRRKLIYMALLLLLPSLISAISIDNDLIGEPDIECLESQIRVWVKTRKPFAGRIYAMGKADDSDCSKDDFNKHKSKKPRFDLPLGMCGMKSLRSMDPRGMYYGVTLVVSFHPLFITKVDQAFHVKCFFEEVNRGLTAELGVSMIPTTELEARHGIPGCSYSIHRSSIADLDAGKPAGAPIQFSRVGERVLHQWHCDDSMFGILINNCYVTDGVNKRAEVIDSRGCPVDPVLITGIRYSSDLQRAYAESQVFKFADRPGIWFFCQIRMCMKKDGMCDGVTPPAGCATTTPPLLSGKSDDEEESQTQTEEEESEEEEVKTTTESNEEIEEEYDETTKPIKATTRHRNPSSKRPRQQTATTKRGKPNRRTHKQFDTDNIDHGPQTIPAPSVPAPPLSYGAPPSPIEVSDNQDSGPTVFGPGFSPEKEAFGENKVIGKDEPRAHKQEHTQTDFETNDDLRPDTKKQHDVAPPEGVHRLSTANSKKDYVDYDSDVTIPPTLTDLLAKLPDDVSKEGIQKMLRDSVADPRALLNSMNSLLNEPSEDQTRPNVNGRNRSRRKPGEKIDRMEVSWDSHRMHDDVMIDDETPTISGQLLIYDLDETPPLGQTLREFGVNAEKVLDVQVGCAISREGLLVLAMSLGSVVSTLIFVIAILCLKQYKRTAKYM